MEQTLVARTNLHVTGTLRWLRSDDRCSVYRSPDGSDVYFAHGTARVLVDVDDVDLGALWQEYRYGYGNERRDNFFEALRAMVIDLDAVDDLAIEFCGFCEDVTTEGDGRETTGNGTLACENCCDEFYRCADCDELYRDTVTTLHDEEVCENCRYDHYSYCEDCDGYYHDDCAHEHVHDGSGCCSVPEPAVRFTIRNDGEEPLANDTRATVRLPAGTIDAEGMGEIANALREYAYSIEGEQRDQVWSLAYRLMDTIGDTWQTRQGNFTKRLSRHVYNEYKIKLPQDLISRIGCIASDHSRAVDVHFETTRLLDMSAEEFYHEDSCWWQSYSSSRCALKSNGGFGLRTFNNERWGDTVTGRAWVMPMRKNEAGGLTPTFNTETPDAYVVFNGYGDLEGYAPARIMAHMSGWTYRKIGFTCSPMYVNNNSGYLVAPEEIASNYTDGSLSLYLDHHADLFHTESQKELSYA